MIQWHRLLGLTLTDFFSDTSYDVELEKDLSVKQQLLDVVIIEKHAGGPLKECPDGVDDLAKHNLLTYKSHQQILDEWTIHELVGHYVNYRKQISPSPDDLLPFGDFRLYAVSARFPSNLAEAVPFEPVTDGVYDIRWGNLRVRIIVLSKIREKPENAIWQMYSAVPDKVQSGAKMYRWRKRDVSGVINYLFNKYNMEGVAMPYTVEDYKKDNALRYIHNLPPGDLMVEIRKYFAGLTPEEKKVCLEDTLEQFKGFSRKDMATALRKQLSGLTPEEKKVFMDELLKSDK